MQDQAPLNTNPASAWAEWAMTDSWRTLASRYANAMFKDHAFIRMMHLNMHRLGPDMYRSAQPTPWQFDGLAAKGIRTIINLRGRRTSCGSYFFEVRACARLNITLIDFPVRSRDTPRKEDLFAARSLFAGLQGPTLMHCKAGADRAGFMSVLHQFLAMGKPMPEAMKQLSWHYGHVKQAKTGILDQFFKAFVDSGGTSVDDFYAWVEHDYDPVRFKAEFMSNRIANFITDGVLRRE